MWRTIKVIFIVTLILLFTILVLQNTQPTEIYFFTLEPIRLPTVFLLVVTLLGGFLLGFLSAKLGSRKARKKKEAKSPPEVVPPSTPPLPATPPPSETLKSS
ncbi:MAG: lipopolysaccharide assembly protein LapA domain-containing protein [Bacteroidota bacterium]